MTKRSAAVRKRLVELLLLQYGTTLAEELGIHLARKTPAPLFRMLVAAILLSARIRSSIALGAAKALFEAGWTTPRKLADSRWAARVKVLNRAGYARYDESTARTLGDTATMLLREYRGDLRVLRERAGRQPPEERRALKSCKGLGDVGVDIFFREVQVAWDELFPFVDKKALRAARRLDLGGDPQTLLRLVTKDEYVRLAVALVRLDLSGEYDRLLALADVE